MVPEPCPVFSSTMYTSSQPHTSILLRTLTKDHWLLIGPQTVNSCKLQRPPAMAWKHYLQQESWELSVTCTFSHFHPSSVLLTLPPTSSTSLVLCVVYPWWTTLLIGSAKPPSTSLPSCPLFPHRTPVPSTTLRRLFIYSSLPSMNSTPSIYSSAHIIWLSFSQFHCNFLSQDTHGLLCSILIVIEQIPTNLSTWNNMFVLP